MPELFFLPDQNYDCVMCGKGCVEDWDVHVDPEAAQAVKGSRVELRVIQDYGKAFLDEPGGWLVNRKEENRCVFLGEDKLCDIHRELGIEAKPHACRQFPFQFTITPEGIYVGISYFCTSAQDNSGKPLSEHRGEVMELLKRARPERTGFADIVLHGEARITWQAYKDLEAALVAALDEMPAAQAIGKAVRAVVRAADEGNVDLASVFAQTPAEDLDEDSMMAGQNDVVLANIFSVLENVKDRRALAMAYLQGDEVELPRAPGRTVSLMGVESRMSSALDGFQDAQVRYLKALAHRKFLVRSGPLLENLLVFYFLPKLLALYAALGAELRGGEVAWEDVRLGLDVCEAWLATHGKGLEPLFTALAQATALQLQSLSTQV